MKLLVNNLNLASLKKLNKFNSITYLSKQIIHLVLITIGVVALYIWGQILPNTVMKANFSQMGLKPSFRFLFGTDWLGRDVFLRSLKALGNSMTISFSSALLTTVLGISLGVLAGLGIKFLDNIIGWLIDLVMGFPSLIFLILVMFAFNGNPWGLILGISITHWPLVARVSREKVIEIRQQEYVMISKSIGKENFWIIKNHYLPHLLPIFFVNLVVMVPHAILQESAVTFLGLGLTSENPGIGILLSESLRYMDSGMWWLVILPGILLVTIIFSIDKLGTITKRLLDPSIINN